MTGYESESQQDKARQGMHTPERTSILVNASPSKQLLPPTHHPHALLSFSTAYYGHIFWVRKIGLFLNWTQKSNILLLNASWHLQFGFKRRINYGKSYL